MYECFSCDATYNNNSSLRTHFRRQHAGFKIDELYGCNDCEQIFETKSAIKNHVKRHMNRCDICHAEFDNRSELIVHKCIEHNIGYRNQPPSVRCPIDDCNYTSVNYHHFRSHIMDDHDIPIYIQSCQFKDMDEFRKWKENLENSNRSQYVLHSSGKKCIDGGIKFYYRCHRDGIPRLNNKNRLRAFKKKGSTKTGKSCPAFMNVKRTNDCIFVSYNTLHLHPKSIEHLNLSRTERSQIAEKLANGATVKNILDDIRNSIPNESVQLQRIHVLSKMDIKNIRRDYGLLKRNESAPIPSSQHISEISAKLSSIPDLLNTILDLYYKSSLSNDETQKIESHLLSTMLVINNSLVKPRTILKNGKLL